MEIQTSKQQGTLPKEILLVGVLGTNFELLILNCILFTYNVHKCLQWSKLGWFMGSESHAAT